MSSMAMQSLQRVYAMVLRHTYLIRKSWVRIVDMAYWPTMNMVLWGFIAQFFATNSSYIAQAPGLLISALLLWETLFRGQLGFALAFLEEFYSRNLGHLFVSPLRPYELVLAMTIVSLIRAAIGVGTATLLAAVLYHYSIFDMGFALIGFFANLFVTAWAIGLMVCALVMRYGLAAENFAWGLIFVAAPISGVYYPISVLPSWLQNIAWWMPTSHVFEGMRGVLLDHDFRWTQFYQALGLNALYMCAGIALFLASFRGARERGMLLQMGE